MNFDYPEKVKRFVARLEAIVAPNVTLHVLDRAIQAHGGAGVSDDFPLAYLWASSRTLRLADGPDEVHRASVAKLELENERRIPAEQAWDARAAPPGLKRSRPLHAVARGAR